jgi:ubiquinone/menaquinone biosynthesis C-methylase UbiE
MDYDKTTMPESYDRGRTQLPGVRDMWMDRVAEALAGHAIALIVDLGCGTGRFTHALADRFGAHVVGIDPSFKMLAQANAKPAHPRVTFAKGTGESMPVAAASADLVFSSMAFHHFADSDQVARECRRVLRLGGAVSIRNSTRENGSPYEKYFPNYAQTLEKLPAASEIVAPFVRNGFRLSRHETVAHKMADNAKDLAEKASHRADSTLLRLADADFEAGLAGMRALPVSADGPQMIGIDLFTFFKTAV